MTKSPSESNVEDFWQTVFEHKCHTIVMLNRIDEDEDEVCTFTLMFNVPISKTRTFNRAVKHHTLDTP